MPVLGCCYVILFGTKDHGNFWLWTETKIGPNGSDGTQVGSGQSPVVKVSASPSPSLEGTWAETGWPAESWWAAEL